MRTVFLGTSDFAVAVLRRLADSPYRPALVVTPPDRRRGRGRRMSPPPAAIAAGELGLDLLQVESVNLPEGLQAVRAADAEVGIVCAFGQLIREPLLSEVELLNVHPSLLPRWRGAAPIERAVMAGDERTGVSIMRVTEGLDSGPVALQESIPIGPDDDYGSLGSRLAELSGELIVRALGRRRDGELAFADQDDGGATYAEKIEAPERRLDPSRPAGELGRAVRGLNPHIGTYLELADGARLGVGAAAPEDGDVPHGELALEDGALRLGCGRGVLRLDVVQPQGSRPMPADAYARGHSLPVLARPG